MKLSPPEFKQRIRAIESSESMKQASLKAGISRQRLEFWLKSEGLRAIKPDNTYKIVKESNEK